jgi:predicted short-subunit dehydrogenase-like oxidoreductase (DUF2520 family)
MPTGISPMRELERDTPHSAARVEAQAPIAVIGRGRLGTSLARGARAAGFDVRLAGRDEVQAACTDAEIALLCVPDAEIEAACAAVAELHPPPRFVAHPSGATPLGALERARERGCEVFSIHPLQTVPDGEATLTGAPAAISGSSPEALERARSLAVALGMRPFEVPEEARVAYHAAASMASNFLVALEESAADLLAAAGVDDARELLTPLVLQSAANWAERGPAALTGPIARGDEATVARHLEALAEAAPELIPLYEELATRAQGLAERERLEK